MDVGAILNDRLGAVEKRLQAACQRGRRERGHITLVAVTKTVSTHVAGELHSLGVRDLGENRPQELWNKAATLPGSVRWHLIGHLQRNKIERTLPLVCLIHSIDSLRLIEAIEQQATRLKMQVDVLLEINASREANKTGLAPEDVPRLVPELLKLQSVRIRGVMAMAAFADDPEDCRPTFVVARQLRDDLRQRLAPHPCDELSMGMTNDFEVAIEEGATLVRIGSALFEGLPPEAT